jgi:hypothetical protein
LPGRSCPPFFCPVGTIENSPAIHCREISLSHFFVQLGFCPYLNGL